MKSTLSISFTVSGLAGCLSHQETMRLFQRAFARAGMKIWFSQGFNPRPKMTIPLPRPVSVNSNDELLCVNIEQGEDDPFDTVAALDELQTQMPDGIDIKNVEFYPGRASFMPVRVEYLFDVAGEAVEPLKGRIENLARQIEMADQIPVRRVNTAKKIDKQFNAAEFIEVVEIDGGDLVFTCRIRQDGSIRVEELMNLAGLKPEDLAVPVLRRRVEWIKK